MRLDKKSLERCPWVGSDRQMIRYHDREWGVPLKDSRALWEMLVLEGFQAGLAWIVVLKKRAALRKAFVRFNPKKVAQFTKRDVRRLMRDSDIIRSRAKIEATISAARIYCAMADCGEDFASFCWSFSGGKVVVGSGKRVPTQSKLSHVISKELKRRGFKFVGPTIVYAWMQAVGIVNDHSIKCHCRKRRV